MDYSQCSFKQLRNYYESGQISFDTFQENIQYFLDAPSSFQKIHATLSFLTKNKHKFPKLIKSVQIQLETISISKNTYYHPDGYDFSLHHVRFVISLLQFNLRDYDLKSLIEVFKTTDSVNLQVAIFHLICKSSNEAFPSELLFVIDSKGFYDSELIFRILNKLVRIFNVFGYYTHCQPSDSRRYIELFTPFVVKQLKHPDQDIQAQALCILGSSNKQELLSKLLPFLYSKDYVSDTDSDDFVEHPKNGMIYDRTNGRPISDFAVISMCDLDLERSIPYFLAFLKEPNLTDIDYLNPRYRILRLLSRLLKTEGLKIPEIFIEPLCNDDQDGIAVEALILLNDIYLSKNEAPISFKIWAEKLLLVKSEFAKNRIIRYLKRSEWFEENNDLQNIIDENNRKEISG